MADFSPDTLIKRHDTLKADRGVWEQHWQEIAELVRPMRAEFTGRITPGSKRTEKIFDGTAGVAADNLASGLWGLATNGGTEWFALRHQDDAINADPQVAVWLDDCTKRMRATFNANGQQFYAQADEFIGDLVTLGTGVFYDEEVPGQGRVRFATRHLAETLIAENEHEQIDTVYRRFEFTARQALRMWPDTLPAELKRAADKEPDRKFPFLHCVMPRDDYNPRAVLSLKGKPFASYYVAIEGKKILAESGYHEFPYQVARWSKASRGLYGDSPAMLALPDIKMLNQMSKTTLIGAQKQVDPPILAPDEGVLRGIRTAPGQPIYGAVDSQGRALVQPFQTGGKLNLGYQLEEQRRTAIREAFFYSLMMLAGGPPGSPSYRTAYEVMVQNEERMRVMGPQLARLQSEFLDPLITRVFAIMFRAGAFADPPPILAQYPGLDIEYVSPLARAQKAQRGGATVRAIQAIGPLAQFDPGVFDNIDTDFVVRDLADAYGMPARGLRDPKDVARIRQQRAQTQNMAAMAQNAAPVAGAIKSLAETRQIMQQPAEQPQGAAA